MKRVHLWGSLKKSLNVQSDEVLINQVSRTKTGKKDSLSLGLNGFNFFQSVKVQQLNDKRHNSYT